jgi:endonuclease/exonuclease/phosphatase (EEP) superfamily protein YafD
LLCVAALLVMKSRRMALVTALLLLIPLGRIIPGYLPSELNSAERGVFRITSYNVQASNRDHARSIDWVKESAPPVIFFTEVSEEWTEALQELEGIYPHFINDGPDFAFFSKFPIVHHEVHRVSEIEFRLLEAHLATKEGGEVVVFAGHPLPPLSGRWGKALDDFVAALVQELSREQGRVVVVGDFNATRWSRKTKVFEEIGLREASKGRAPGPTWNRGHPVLGIPIDRILYRGEGMSCRSFEICPDLGSDHRAVTAEIVW